jgi:hypothetical protein
MATVELSVDANLSGLRQQLESIPGLTAEQARLMTAELNKSIRASERAAKAAADASKRAMASASESAREAAADVGKVGDRFGTVGSSASKLAGALSMLGPALGDSARNVADLADVGEVGALAFEGFGAVLLPLTATLALFAAGLAPIGELILEEQRRAEQTAVALEKYEAATKAADEANAKFASSLSGVNDYIRISTGLETMAAQTARRRYARKPRRRRPRRRSRSHALTPSSRCVRQSKRLSRITSSSGRRPTKSARSWPSWGPRSKPSRPRRHSAVRVWSRSTRRPRTALSSCASRPRLSTR